MTLPLPSEVGGASVAGLGSGLVEPALADVADPLHDVVVAVVQFGLKHLEVAHLQPRAGKGDLGCVCVG